MDANTKEIKQLEKWLRSSHHRFKAASAMWLNRAATHVRELARGEILTHMTTRSPRFIDSRLRYEKVRRGASLRDQVAYAGSIGADNFSGWAEQEETETDRRDKVITLAARGGKRSKRLPAGRRMRNPRTYTSPDKYKGRSARQRATIMLQHLGRTNYRRPFRMFGHPSFTPGLYRFTGKDKIKSLQLFKTKPKRTKPFHWLRRAEDKYFRTLNTRAVWGAIVRYIVLPKNKR